MKSGTRSSGFALAGRDPQKFSFLVVVHLFAPAPEDRGEGRGELYSAPGGRRFWSEFGEVWPQSCSKTGKNRRLFVEEKCDSSLIFQAFRGFSIRKMPPS